MLDTTIRKQTQIYNVRKTWPLLQTTGDKDEPNISKSNIKIVERDQIETPYTQIHDRSLFNKMYNVVHTTRFWNYDYYLYQVHLYAFTSK